MIFPTIYLHVMHEIKTESPGAAKGRLTCCEAGLSYPGTTTRQIRRCRRAIDKARRKDNRRSASIRKEIRSRVNPRWLF